MSRIFHTRITRKGKWEKTRREVIKRDNFRCQSCGRILSYWNFEVDHVKPLHLMTAEEDPYDKSGLQTLCSFCHSQKTAKENNKRIQPKEVREWTEFVNELRGSE